MEKRNRGAATEGKVFNGGAENENGREGNRGAKDGRGHDRDINGNGIHLAMSENGDSALVGAVRGVGVEKLVELG